MRSSVTRRLIKLKWAKEHNIDRLFEEEQWLVLPGEHEYRLMCQYVWNKPIHLPSLSAGPNQLLFLCYSQLMEDEDNRRESMELVDLMIRTQMHNALVNAAASNSDAAEAGRISPKDMDALMSLLHSVHKITNPLAVRPQSYASDQMQEAFERNKELFNVPWQIKRG